MFRKAIAVAFVTVASFATTTAAYAGCTCGCGW